jgi:hypothetical protein
MTPCTTACSPWLFTHYKVLLYTLECALCLRYNASHALQYTQTSLNTSQSVATLTNIANELVHALLLYALLYCVCAPTSVAATLMH